MIFLGCISAGTVTIQTAQSIERTTVSQGAKYVYYHHSGPYLDTGRNMIIRVFNRPEFRDADKLLMVDSDIEFLADDIRRLDEDDLPIVSGVYHTAYDQNVLPVVYEWADVNGIRTMGPIGAWSDCEIGEEATVDDPIVVAAGVGAGFLMVKREVLDVMEATYGDPLPWFAEEVYDGVHFGEDLTFCIRALKCGFETSVDRRVQVAHHKGIRLGGPQPVASSK